MRGSNFGLKDPRTVFKTILEECTCTSKSSDTKWLFKISYKHSAILANLTNLLQVTPHM